MKNLLAAVVLMFISVGAWSQVPQFTSTDYEDWVYNNPSIELNTTNILANRIVLYTTSTGLIQDLISPVFDSYAGQTIDMSLIFVTDQWKSASFVKSKVALTAALLNEQGATVDSVTWVPTDIGRYNYLNMSLRVSRTLRNARLRFVSWKADVNSSGAIRQITATSALRGDVNLDGEVTVADVNAIIDVIVKDETDPELLSRADVNQDGEVSIADINNVVDILLR